VCFFCLLFSQESNRCYFIHTFVPRVPQPTLKNWDMAEIAVNYTGPSAANNLFHSFPHINIQTFRYFTPITPQNVLDNISDYLLSIVFLGGLLMFVWILFPIGVWISECCRHCECCDPLRAPCECDGCPKRCCSLLTFNANKPQADVLAPTVIFGTIGVVFALLTMVYQVKAANNVIDVTNIFRQLADMQSQTTADYNAATDQMGVNGNNLVQLIDNSTTAGADPNEILKLRIALVQVQVAQDSLGQATDNASKGFDIASNVDYVRLVVRAIIISSIIYFILVIGMLVGTLTAALSSPTPVYQVIVAFSSTKAVFLLIFGMFVISPLTAALIAAGDLCQDPLAYMNQQNLRTGNSDYAGYYINCAPGSVFPELANLQLAQNNTASALSLVQEFSLYTYENGTFPYLFNQSVVIEKGLTLSGSQIDTLIGDSDCTHPHNLMTEALEQGCGNSFSFNSVWIFTLPSTLLCLLAVDCVMPRAKDPDAYTALKRRRRGGQQQQRDTVETAAAVA